MPNKTRNLIWDLMLPPGRWFSIFQPEFGAVFGIMPQKDSKWVRRCRESACFDENIVSP